MENLFVRNDKFKGKKKLNRKKSPKYITSDIDSHNGVVWKGANSIEGLRGKQTRSRTYDADLGRIGD